MTSQYYDSENITESKLSFRKATTEPQNHGRNDDMCMRVLYDMDGCVVQHRRLLNPTN